MIVEQIKLERLEPTIHPHSQISNVDFGIYNEIGTYNFIENTKMGDYSYTEQFCFIQNTRIGKFANIAASVRIGPTDHPMDRASLHHFTYRPAMYGFRETDDEDFFSHRESRLTTIGHDTWIGHGAIVLPEVKIGNGAVIGAGSVVTKDVPPYAIVVGNPARIVRYRFDEATIEDLEAIAWWDWPEDLLRDRLEDFRLPIGDFIRIYKEDR